jgi:hypothetical protein
MRCVNNKLTVANKQDSERSAIPIANGTSGESRSFGIELHPLGAYVHKDAF